MSSNLAKVNIDNNDISNQNDSVKENEQSKKTIKFDEMFIKSYFGNKADKMYDSVKKAELMYRL